MNPPSLPEEIFRRLLDESSALLSEPTSAGLAFPDDDLHRDILLPLLPAMLGDDAIRKHWREQTATGFLARLTRHLEAGEPAPRWLPGDFEIHVTASYTAGPDAKALADTLLSEDSLRDMSAALMNQILECVWPGLVPPPAAELEVVAAPIAETVLAPSLSVEVAAASESMTIAAVLGTPVMAMRAFRVPRPNPIRGTQTSHGGLGAPDWTASYPVAGSHGAAVP